MEYVVNPSPLYEGKVISLYATNDSNVLLMRRTDRISALKGEQKEDIPGKALANSLVSTMLYKRFEDVGIPTHIVSEGPDLFSKFIRKAYMIKLEVILRNIAAGSFCERYAIKKGHHFDIPVIEYNYKNDELDDPLIVEEVAIELDIVSVSELMFINKQVRKINRVASDFFQKMGLNLVDFKVEFGADIRNGNTMLCDEFSLDTCRLWDKSGQSWDKDIYHNDNGEEAIKKQATVYQQLIEKLKKEYPKEIKEIMKGYQI